MSPQCCSTAANVASPRPTHSRNAARFANPLATSAVGNKAMSLREAARAVVAPEFQLVDRRRRGCNYLRGCLRPDVATKCARQMP
eukprot:2029746-Lingulodinium_polyedra.AAC.1